MERTKEEAGIAKLETGEKKGIYREVTGGKKKHMILLAFFLTLICVSLVIIMREYTPFGDNCMLIRDFAHQYYPFLLYLKRSIMEGNGIGYSWKMGFGTDFYEIYAYYLSNPLNLFVLLIPESWILGFMTISVILQISLSAASFTYYLQKHFKSQSYYMSLFGVCYALSGYIGAYFWDIMWLGVIVFAPIVIYQMERLVLERKGTLYAVSLGLAIICNYYLSMHLCFFLVIYFVLFSILHFEEFKQHWLKIIGMFAGFSLLAGGIAGYLLIPTVYTMLNSAYASTVIVPTWDFYFSIFEAFERHMFGTFPSFESQEPNIYTGVMVFLLIPFFFLSKQIKGREKVVYGILVLGFLLFFSCDYLNYFAHGLNYPQCMPCRQSFLYEIVILTMCYRGFIHVLEAEKKTGVFISLGIGLLFVALGAFVFPSEMIRTEGYVVTAVLLVLYSILLWRMRFEKNDMIVLLWGAFLISELYLNFFMMNNYEVDQEEFFVYQEDMQAMLDENIEQKENTVERVDIIDGLGDNDTILYDRMSNSLFTSTIQDNVRKYCTLFGIVSNRVKYHNSFSTPLFQGLMNTKYVVSSIEKTGSYGMKEIDAREIRNANKVIQGDQIIAVPKTYYLYDNQYALDFGVPVYETLEDDWYLKSRLAPEVENELAMQLIGEPVWDIDLRPVGNKSIEYKITEEGVYYVFFHTDQQQYTKLFQYDPDGESQDYMGDNTLTNKLLYMGYLEKGSRITTSFEEEAEDFTFNFIAFKLREDAFEKLYQILHQKVFTIEQIHGNTLTGTADMEKSGNLILSIPYADGWTLQVDGEETEIQDFAGALISIPLTEGTHHIEMHYRTKGLLGGFLLSFVSIGICVITTIMTNNRKKHLESR